jgi:hypothetical protein
MGTLVLPGYVVAVAVMGAVVVIALTGLWTSDPDQRGVRAGSGRWAR